MESPRDGLAGMKTLFKGYPRLYRALAYIFGAQPHNMTAHAFVRKLPRGIRIIDVGSGPRKLRDDVICIDVFKFDNVDIVADAAQLPFENGSIDALVSDNVLEHVRDPKRVVAEFIRVLKPSALVYIAVPFNIPFHSSPDDYYRWTEVGLRELLKDFSEQELKIQFGPSAAFTAVFSEWMAILLSFNSKILYTFVLYVMTTLTVPLKLFDYLLVHYRHANILALSFYFIGKKK